MKGVNVMLKKIKYGWIPDVPDKRDLYYRASFRIPADLPKAVDLRQLCSKVEDQGQVGSCTANALAGTLEFLELKDKTNFADFSRLFIYYNERLLEGKDWVKVDGGAALRDGIKSLVKWGVCSEKLWPYVESKFAVKPPKECYDEAENYKITSYSRLQTLNEMRACLATGFPFVFGMAVFESFEYDNVTKTGIMTVPDDKEKMLGGHAVMGVGYNDNDKNVIVRNSWSEKWGDKGYFYMPYDYISNDDLCTDFWTIRAGGNM
jgi:C1A family cysteine protease